MGRAALLLALCLALAGLPAPAREKSASEEPPKGENQNPQNYWAWQPLRPGELPALPATWQKSWSAWAGNPIDRYVAAKLFQEGLEPSPQADPETLLRRLHLDLTGLPPTPEDRHRFLAKPDDAAWAAEVDRLLASRSYAEKWARHWLDVARFAESQGFEYDRPRDQAWPYRDWVINAFHTDLPYPDFVKQQIAGDLLPMAGPAEIAATGFLVAGPFDQAGSSSASRVVRERAREDEMEEMVGTTTQAFLALTAHCARCHDHKFDPISLKEYHGLKAALSGVKLGVRGLLGPAEMARRKSELEKKQKELKQIDQELDAIRLKALARKTDSTPVEEFPAALAPKRWSFWGRETPSGEMLGNARIQEGENPGLILDGQGSHYRSAPLEWELGEKTLEVWVKLANLNQRGGGVLTLELLDGTQFDSIVFGELEPGYWLAGSEGHRRSRPLSTLGAKPEVEPNRLVHLALVFAANGEIRLYRDGKPQGTSYRPDSAQLKFKSGQVRALIGMRHTGGGSPFFQGEVLEARVYPFALDANQVAQSHQSGYKLARHAKFEALLEPAEADRWKQLGERRKTLTETAKTQEDRDPQAFAAVATVPGVQKVLTRGDIDRPESDAIPGGIQVLNHAPANWNLRPDEPDKARRLALADWIAHENNALAHRVWVNRIWQHHFGTGLVDTPSDFGKQGSRPTHPELLDYLVAAFRKEGFHTKPLHRLIVTSRAYRQSSADRALALEKDSQSRYLWRFPPRRLEAEAIRDSMLAVSGELKSSLGGPGFRPFKIESFNSVFYKPLENEEPDFLKRTIYRMVIRSARSPLLEAFDCPDPTVRTPKRVPTTTPIQALALMNDQFVIRRSAHLAEALSQVAPGEGAKPDVAKGVERLWLLAYSREIRAEEKQKAVEVAQKVGLEPVVWAVFNSSEFLDLR